MHRYYLLFRPAMPGTIPQNANNPIIDICNYDFKQYDACTGRAAWGYVDYTSPLSDADISNYELWEGVEND